MHKCESVCCCSLEDKKAFMQKLLGTCVTHSGAPSGMVYHQHCSPFLSICYWLLLLLLVEISRFVLVLVIEGKKNWEKLLPNMPWYPRKCPLQLVYGVTCPVLRHHLTYHKLTCFLSHAKKKRKKTKMIHTVFVGSPFVCEHRWIMYPNRANCGRMPFLWKLDYFWYGCMSCTNRNW